MLCSSPSRVNGIGDAVFVPQLWGVNNIRINVTYDRVVPDAEHNVVVVDLLETVVRDHLFCIQQEIDPSTYESS